MHLQQTSMTVSSDLHGPAAFACLVWVPGGGGGVLTLMYEGAVVAAGLYVLCENQSCLSLLTGCVTQADSLCCV